MSRPGRVLACWGLMLACQLGFGFGVAVVLSITLMTLGGNDFLRW